MSTNRRLIPVIAASVGIIVLVVAVIWLALVPLPEFEAFESGRFEGRLAYVDEQACLLTVDLATGDDHELFCEDDRYGIEDLQWTAAGLEFTSYGPSSMLRVVDPETGETLSSEPFDFDAEREIPEPSRELYTDKRSGELTLKDDSREIYRTEAPDRYWIEFFVKRGDGLYAFADSTGRLAVFEAGETPMLVAKDVRPWGGATFEPLP